MGIQSFLDCELKIMNRVHNVKQGINSIRLTSRIFDNFSVDLIYGIPESILINNEKIVLKKFIGPLNEQDFNDIKKLINSLWK